MIPFPRTIDTTGRRDATSDLNAWISSFDSDSIAVIPAGATLRCEEAVRIDNKTNFVLKGNRSAIVAHSTNNHHRKHVVIEAGRGIQVHELNVIGPHTGAGSRLGAWSSETEGQHGFAAYGVTDLLLQGVRVNWVFGDFVYLGRDPYTGLPCRSVRINKGVFSHSGRHGITVVHGDGVEVSESIICETARASVDLEPNHSKSYVQNVVVSDNIFGPGRLRWLAAAGNQRIENVYMLDNQLVGKALTVHMEAPQGQIRRNFVIRNNESDAGPNNTPIYAHGIEGLVVVGNTQRLKFGASGILLSNSTATEIKDNTWTYPDGSSGNEITTA